MKEIYVNIFECEDSFPAFCRQHGESAYYDAVSDTLFLDKSVIIHGRCLGVIRVENLSKGGVSHVL